jgi:hypothetical protein
MHRPMRTMRVTVPSPLNAPTRQMKKPRKKPFKPRLDLLKHITPEDFMESALANLSRYKPEPSLAKTGVGYRRTATSEERQAEMARSEAFIKRLEARGAAAKRAKRKKKS